MSRKWLFILVASILVLALAACAGSAEVSTTAPGDTDTDTSESHDDDIDADSASDSDADHDTNEIAASIDAANIFSQRCSGCHGQDRGGSRGPALLPNVLTKNPTSYANTITNGSGAMPSWGNRLSADEINALVEFIMSDS